MMNLLRIKRAVVRAVIGVVCIAATSLGQFFYPPWGARQALAAPNVALHGAAAIQHLKTDGSYASLAAAMTAARNQINAAPAQPNQSGAPFYANNPGQRTIDPILTQQRKLTAADGAAVDRFGEAVALSGDTAVIGAPNDDAASVDQGSAYVFVRSGTSWKQQKHLVADDGAQGDRFGISVGISGDTVVVGAEAAAVGGKASQGAVYVFVRNGTDWTQQQKLVANDGAAVDDFGHSVSVSGDSVVAGAPFDDVGTAVDQGSAYVFVRCGAVWTQQQKLTADDGAAADGFGDSVAISGDTVVAGAPNDDVGANLVQGSAYVFVRGGTTWTQQQQLVASDGASTDKFGIAVALSGDTAVVGAPFDKVGATSTKGSAYVFARSGPVWKEQQQLVAQDGAANDLFGFSVAISGDIVVAGAEGDDIGTSGNQGSAYIFAREGTSWTQQQRLTADDGAAFDNLGFSVAISGDTVVAGALNDDVDANTDQGSVYVFVSPACPAITLAPATLPDAMIDAEYNQTLTASSDTGPFQFSLSDGSLPPGLALAQDGQLAGTPTAAGAFRFTITATAPNSLCNGSRSYTLTVGSQCPTITVNPATLPNATLGEVYFQPLTTTAGAAPISFVATAGALPSGLRLAANGVLSGIATATGTFNFTVTAADAKGCRGTRAYALTVTDVAANDGLQFFPLVHPVRLLDTRPGQSGCFTPGAPIAGGTTRLQPAQGICDGLSIPANARAVTGNITTVNSGGGFLTLFPSDAAQPLAASANYAPNEIVNNVFTVGLGADGAFKIFALNTTDVAVDVTGYYAPPGKGGLYFHPLPHPIRLLETRAGQTGCTAPAAPLAGGTETPQLARLTCDGVTIPNTALAVVGNATTVSPQGPGFLTLFPANAARPLVASSNYEADRIVNGPFTVGLSATGHFNIFTLTTTHLVVDVLGYYSAEAQDVNGAGLLFNPLSKPVRLLETRVGQAGCYTPGLPLTGNTERSQPARGTCQGETIPASALAIVGNATVVNAQGGFLTLWPSNAARPLVASSNFVAGQVFNRHFTVGLGNDGAFNIFASGTTDLVVDVSGFFAP